MRNTRSHTDTRDADGDRMRDALIVVADVLGHNVCWLLEDRFHFLLDDGECATLAVSADSAERVRLEAWHGRRVIGTVWTLAHDHARLAAIARDIADGVDVRLAT